MKSRVLSNIALVASVLLAGPAVGQQPASSVAKLADLVGDVLVSRGDALVSGANGMPLPVGTRVVTTAGAKVTINYDFGCDVRLDENSRFTVRTGADCAVLAKEVVALGPASGAIGGGVGVATFGAVDGFVAGAVIGGGIALVLRPSDTCEICPPVSPN